MATAGKRDAAGTAGVTFPTGWFCISLDFELAWGIVGEPGWHDYRHRLDNAPDTIDRLCKAFDAHEISATWATVGAIMLRSLDDPLIEGRPLEHYREVLKGPRHQWFAPQLIERIIQCETQQDIGCHGFTHWLFDEANGAEEARARWELERCYSASMIAGLTPKSFVFPCNVEGFHQMLRDAGMFCYRGSPKSSQGGPAATRPGRAIQRASRLLDQALGLAPTQVWPERHPSGMWNIPASAFLMPLSGVRGIGGSAARRRKLRAGMDRAAESGGLFHLWSHPHNFMADSERMLGLLEETLQSAAEARKRGDIRTGSMLEIAEACQNQAGRGS